MSTAAQLKALTGTKPRLPTPFRGEVVKSFDAKVTNGGTPYQDAILKDGAGEEIRVTWWRCTKPLQPGEFVELKDTPGGKPKAYMDPRQDGSARIAAWEDALSRIPAPTPETTFPAPSQGYMAATHAAASGLPPATTAPARAAGGLTEVQALGAWGQFFWGATAQLGYRDTKNIEQLPDPVQAIAGRAADTLTTLLAQGLIRPGGGGPDPGAAGQPFAGLFGEPDPDDDIPF